MKKKVHCFLAKSGRSMGVWLLSLFVVQAIICSPSDNFYEGVDEDVRMLVELAQDFAGKEQHPETSPLHLLDVLVKNSRILQALPKEDRFDLQQFLEGALKKFPKTSGKEEDTNSPPFSSSSLGVVKNAKQMAEAENSQTKAFHLYEALFLCDDIVAPLTAEFFDTLVVQHSLSLMSNARKARKERDTGECGDDEEKEEGAGAREEQKAEYVEQNYPTWLKNKIGEGSGWSMFLNTSKGYRPSLSPQISKFGFDVLELIPENSIVIVTGQPLYQIFLELPNIVRKELINKKNTYPQLTEENTKGVRGLRRDVFPLYTGYLKDYLLDKKDIYFPSLSFPAHLYSPTKEGENSYNLLEFIDANIEKFNIFMATDPLLDQGGVWEDLGWTKEYSLIPHGFCHKLIKKTAKKEEDWYQPHLDAVLEMTEKVKIKKITDTTIKVAFWNVIRLFHKKIVEDEIAVDKERQMTIFLRKILKKTASGKEFAPIDILYLYCLSYMKWVYPEIGSELLPNPERFRKHRKQIEAVIARYQTHPDFKEAKPMEQDTIKSFGQYLEMTERALQEYETEQKLEL